MEITGNLVSKKLPKRPKDANKGTLGKALIIAGSKNFPGASILSVLACARVGAGLVTLATSPEVYKISVSKIPFATFLDFSEIEENLEKYDAILIGPGLGMNKDSGSLISELVEQKELKNKKLIIDADGLNFLSETRNWYKKFNDAILTPHPGEMSRLTNLSIDEIQNSRQEITQKFAKIWNKVVILKGAETVIANPKGETFVSPFSNPLLATAGTGDVLAGVIAGLLAQGLNLVDASIVGVYIHGLSAEKLKGRFNDSGMVATDLIDKLPEVIRDLKFP